MYDYTTHYRLAVKRLRSVYDPGEASAVARLLFEELTGLSYSAGLVRASPFTEEEVKRMEGALGRLEKGEPLQYVLGYAYFLGLKISVSPAVLIPRPETEELVQWMLEDHSRINEGGFLDIGSGSGCIPVSFGKMKKDWEVFGLDISAEALSVLEKNALSNHVTVRTILSDFTGERNWVSLGKYDLICSNPPYIPQAEEAQLHSNVKDFEPHLALFVPDSDALLFYRKIAHFGLKHLNSGGSIYCELHKDMAEETAELFRETGYNEVVIRRDIHGAQRMLRARRT